MPRLREGGTKALVAMERHLGERRDWFVGDGPTLADFALYAYTHCCEEGEFELEPYPAIRAWIARVEAIPGHVPMAA